MATQFISSNKNFKRLFDAPLDPTLSWESESALREYLNDPTCYVDQIVGCLGKAYIIVEVDGAKDIQEIGTISADNGRIYVGDSEPSGEEDVWIDTSESDESYIDDLESAIIEEFRSVFKNLQSQITELKQKNYELEARVAYLEEYGGGNSGGNGGGTETPDDGTDGNIILTFEDGSILTFEDGSILTFEGSNSESISNNNIMTFEDGSILTFEDGSILTFEGSNSASTSNDNIMTFESGESLTFEDNSIMIFEK